MQQYLGICLVILVTGLVIAVLARLVTGGILDEIEKIRMRRSERKMKQLSIILEELSKYATKCMQDFREMAEKDRKSKNERYEKFKKEFEQMDE